MELGDILLLGSTQWFVYKIDSSTKTAFISSQHNKNSILGFEEDCKIVSNPIRDWPFVVLPPKKGVLGSIYRATTKGLVTLSWVVDWVKIEDFQEGGALYLNPELKLGYGDRIVRSNRYGGVDHTCSVEIPRDFKILKRKKQTKGL
jgi:hypothetical protein